MRPDPYSELAGLGLELPKVSPPKGSYLPAKRSGTFVFVAGQVPMKDGEVVVTGKVGQEVSLDEAKDLAGQCALAALAAIESVVSLRQVREIVKVVGYVASAPGFSAQAAVLNGASDLLGAVFGDSGRHVRTTVGVFELPLNAPVEVEVTVALDE